jgi:hypothetical protein
VTVFSKDEALFRRLGAVRHELIAELADHKAQYGEVLGTVFLSESVADRVFVECDPDLIDAVNDLLIIGDPHTRNLLVTGLVESSPQDMAVEQIQTYPEPLRTEVARDRGLAEMVKPW